MRGKKLIWKFAWITLCSLAVAFLGRHQLFVPSTLVSVWFGLILMVAVNGSPSAAGYIMEREWLPRLGGWALMTAAILLVPVIFLLVPTWMTAVEKGGVPPVLPVCLSVAVLGIVILALPDSIRAYQENERLEAASSLSIEASEFAGITELGASIRFVASNLKALVHIACPWILVCCGVP